MLNPEFPIYTYLNKDGINCPISPPTVYSSEGVISLSNLVSTAQNPTPPSEDQYTLMHRSSGNQKGQTQFVARDRTPAHLPSQLTGEYVSHKAKQSRK